MTMLRFEKRYPLVLIGSLILGIIAIMTWYAYHKVGYHVDELYSYGLANSYAKPFPNAANQWLKGQYYFDYLTTDLVHRFNYLSVYKNQVQDVHPPVYYFLFHTIASFFPGQFNQWIGLSLNFLTHLLTFAFIVKIIKDITNHSLSAWLTGAAWALSIGGMNTFLFIRMYSLVTLWGVILLALCLPLLRLEKLSLRRGLALWGVLYLGILTHYYYLIYAFFLILILCFLLTCQGKLKTALKLGIGAIMSVGLAYLTFPKMIYHLTQSNRGSETFRNITQQGFKTNLNHYLTFLRQDLFANLPVVGVTVVVLIALGILVFKARRPQSPYPSYRALSTLVITTTAIAYFGLVQVLSQYVTDRYIYLVYPLFIMLIGMTLFTFTVDLGKAGSVLLTVLFFSLIGINLATFRPEFSYPQAKKLEQYNQTYKDLPVITLTDRKWKNIRLVPELSDHPAIYPWVTPNLDSPTSPPERNDFKKGLVVYLFHPKITPDQAIARMKTAYGFKEGQIVYQTKNLSLLLFTP